MAGEKRRRETDASHKKQEKGQLTALHRARLADWQPSAVAHLATSQDGSLAVAVRDDGHVDFYDLTGPYCMRRVIVGEPGTLTCSAIVEGAGAKTAPRVFVAGFDGTVVELGCDSGAAPLSRDDTHGGAVWAMAVCPDRRTEEDLDSEDDDGSQLLAVASEDGAVRLFKVSPHSPGASYERSLPGAGGRVTAIAWHSQGHVLAAAGIDGAIHVRDAKSGHEIVRVSLRTAGVSADLVVWALRFLTDGTLVAGDSSGNVTFWDGRHGTLLARFAQHRADVLSLAASPDGRMVWAAGVDPALAMFRKEHDGTWGLVTLRRPHSHDVRALAVAAGHALEENGNGPVLLSAGNDAVVLMRSIADWQRIRGEPIEDAPQRPLLVAEELVSPGMRDEGQKDGEALVACAGRSGLRLWHLKAAAGPMSSTSSAENSDGHRASSIAPAPELLAEVNAPGIRAVALCCCTNSTTDDDAESNASAPSGTALLAFSDGRRTTLLRLQLRLGTSLVRTKKRLHASPIVLPAGTLPADKLFFAPCSGSQKTLIIATSDGTVQAVDINLTNDAATTSELRASRAAHDLRFKLWALRERNKVSARFWEPALQHAALSPDGRYLAFAFRRRLQLMDLGGQRWGSLLTPGPEALPGGLSTRLVGLAFSSDGVSLGSLTANKHLARHAVPGGQLLPDSETRISPQDLVAALDRLGGGLLGIACHPTLPNVSLITTSRGVCVVDPTKKGRQHKQAWQNVELSTSNLRFIRWSQGVLLGLTFAGAGQLVAVEETWEEARKAMPAPMYRQRYGAA